MKETLNPMIQSTLNWLSSEETKKMPSISSSSQGVQYKNIFAIEEEKLQHPTEKTIFNPTEIWGPKGTKICFGPWEIRSGKEYYLKHKYSYESVISYFVLKEKKNAKIFYMINGHTFHIEIRPGDDFTESGKVDVIFKDYNRIDDTSAIYKNKKWVDVD